MTTRKTSLLLATTSAAALSVFAFGGMGSTPAYADCEGSPPGPTQNLAGYEGLNVADTIECDADAPNGGGTVNGNGGGDTITIDGGSMADVNGNDGDDTIIMLDGLADAISGNSGDDTITVAAFVQNDVVGDGATNGNDGNDLIILNAGADVSSVFGDSGDGSGVDDGDDTIVMNGGQVLGSVFGEGGNDTIKVAGFVGLNVVGDGDTDGNDGDDLIVLNAGANVGSVFGDSGDGPGADDGDDTVVMNAGQVAGSIFGEGGNDTIEMTGGDVAGSVLGDLGDDKITLDGATIQTDLNGGTGNDSIALIDGLIGGDLVGGSGSDVIRMTGGTVGDDVRAGDGDDLITLNGALVENNIRGGVGSDLIELFSGTAGLVQGDGWDDTIAMDGGSVLAITGDSFSDGVIGSIFDGNDLIVTGGGTIGDVWGQGGDDVILQGGADITGDIRGGRDNDRIEVTAGTASIVQGDAGEDRISMIDGSVFAITGDSFLDGVDGAGSGDQIFLLGGKVGLDVWGQGGQDQITLDGAEITGSIRAGNDGDVMKLASGIVGGDVLGGAGDDLGIVTGPFDFADLGGGTGTFAGDRNTDSDQGFDQLVFIDWVGNVNADQLPEWNIIDILNGSAVTFTGGTLETDGGGDIGAAISDTSALLLTNNVADGGNLIIVGDLTNQGLIDLSGADADPDNILTVTDDYNAASDLVLDTFLNDGTPDITDQLIIGGNAGGETDLTIVPDAGSPGGLTGFGPEDGILVVAAETSDPGAFSLTNADLVAGIFEYELVNPAGQPAGQSNWYLQSDWLDQIYVYENLPGAMQTIGSALTGQLVERVGVRSAVPSTLADADGNPVRGGAPVDTAIWGRAVGLSLESDGDLDSTTQGSFEQTIGFLQAGVDVTVLERPSGRLLIGALGHWGTSTLDADNSRGAEVGTADFDFYGGGLTATWYSTGGWYFDNVVQYTAYDIDITTATRFSSTSTDGYGIGTSHEVGYRIPIGATAALVPQGQLTYQHLDFDDFTDPDGVRVSYEDDDSLVGRLGVAFENSAAIGSSLATGYVEANVLYEFLGDNSVNTFTPAGGNIALNQQTREAWVEVGFGGTIAVVEGVSLYGEIDYALPLDGGVRGVQALGGIRVNLNPAPPPPPPAPVIAPVAETAFIVFFDWDRADLTSEANLVLDDVVVVANQSGYASIRLDGYTDLSGSAQYNLGLSERRANSVADGLIARGIAPDEIVIRAFGEENPLVPTPDGVREPQNRRVEIFLS